MGCTKLLYSQKNETVLRFVWRSGEQSKNRVRWYDYGARFYDPQIGRWHVQDLLAEYNFNNTPYSYCQNNPVRLIDLYGLDTTYIHPPLLVVVVKPKPDLKQKPITMWRFGLDIAGDNVYDNGYRARYYISIGSFDDIEQLFEAYINCLFKLSSKDVATDENKSLNEVLKKPMNILAKNLIQ